jgi:hypothetical protein
MALDPQRFPTLAAYIRSLPHGLASYPECKTKGTVVRSALDDAGLAAHLEALPDEVGELVRSPPTITAWVPAVLSDSVFHAACDLACFDEEAVIRWSYERSVRVGGWRVYRQLLSVAGPRFFLRMAERTHALFQKGTDAQVVDLEANRCRVLFTHPPHLHSPLNQASNVGLLRAAIELVGGADVTCRMTESDERHAVFVCTWT